MEKPTVFLSHINEEEILASLLKRSIESDFLGMIDVFVSSDGHSLEVGTKWLAALESALHCAAIQFILCSRTSVERQWINFEAGAGWVKGIPVIPICHTNLRPIELPVPLNMLQGIDARDPNGLKRVYGVLAKQLGSKCPEPDFCALAEKIKSFEREYGFVSHVRTAVRSIVTVFPELGDVFKPSGAIRQAHGEILQRVMDELRQHLDALKGRNLLDYEESMKGISFGPGGGNFVELSINVSQAFYDIADKL